MWLEPLVAQVGFGGKDWRKKLALDEGVVEEELQLFFSGGKDDWQKFWETTLAIDQKEREPAWQEAIFLLMRWKKDDLAFLMVSEQALREWMNEVPECWVSSRFHSLK